MKNLVSNNGGKPTTDSLRIASKFGKQHGHILESIRNLIIENSSVRLMFSESTYISERGRSETKFEVNRDGFSLLVMGFTGKKALEFKLEFIAAFNMMEEELIRIESERIRNLTPAQMLLAQAQQMVEQENKIIALQVKQKETTDQIHKLACHIHTRPDYYTIAGFGRLNGLSINEANAKRLGKIASAICKSNGFDIGSVPDTKWGSVNSYPSDVLYEVFRGDGLTVKGLIQAAF
jgi:Rha family phage regulatory protein